MTPGAVVLPFRSLGGKVRSLYLSAFAQSGITRVITGVECRVDPTYRADFVPDHDVSVARLFRARDIFLWLPKVLDTACGLPHCCVCRTQLHVTQFTGQHPRRAKEQAA